MFTDNLMAHASAAVEMQQIVSGDKITLVLQVSFQGRPFCRKKEKLKLCAQEAAWIYQMYKSTSLREKDQKHGQKPKKFKKKKKTHSVL